MNKNNVSPGYELQQLLLNILPSDPIGNSREDKRLANRIDFVLRADGEFVELIYRSTINYILRRLIILAAFVDSQNEDLTREIFIDALRRSLKTNFDFSISDREKLLIKLIECVDERKKVLKDPTKARFRKEAVAKGNTNCYICGKAVSFEAENGEHDSVEIEHLWPKALGGSNVDDNLKIACHKCNHHKKTFIDTYDYHYEYINNLKLTDFNHTEKLAAWSKTEYRCIKCKRPAGVVGKLILTKLNEDDTWHYLNIVAYCSQHIPTN